MTTPTTVRSVAPPPYVGVTGVVTDADLAALAALAALERPGGRRLMVGVLASFKTLTGLPTTNRRYPVLARVEPLLAGAARVGWPVIHFNAPAREPLWPLLESLLAQAPSCRGLQLNVVRPDPEALARCRAAAPAVELILQVNGASLAARTPASVDAYVRRYAGVVQHALLDLSGGTGRGLDPAWVGAVLAAHAADWLALGITPGLAGGLGPGCGGALGALEAHVAPALLAHCSLDAESGVRRPAADPLPGAPFQDDLDPTAVGRYVRDADALVAHWAAGT